MNTFGSSVGDATTEQSQSSINGGGDGIGEKAEDTIRIGFNNVNGIGMRKEDKKNRDIHQFIKCGDFDIFGITETNVHWKNNGQHVGDITYGWFRRKHFSYQYYKDYPCTAKFQSGGVLQIAIGEITSRVIKHGGDDSGLGRWTWHVLQGQQNRVLRVVTAYRPVRNMSNAGSVWNQHQYHSALHQLDGNPHDRWIRDLIAELSTWIQQGESTILMVDLNDNVLTGKAAVALQQMGMIDALSSRHGPNIPTYQRGSIPIDGIFTTREIAPTSCGYIQAPGDHLCLWMDVQCSTLFEHVAHVYIIYVAIHQMQLYSITTSMTLLLPH
jgi:hypothetical protein